MTRKSEPAKDLVAAVEPMLQMHFRTHTLKRHRFTMRFLTKVEHAADHRLHADVLDHIHEEAQPQQEGQGEEHAEDESAG